DLLHVHFDSRRVDALDLDLAVGVADAHCAAGAQRVGFGPLLGRAARQRPEAAAGEANRGERRGDERRAAGRRVRIHGSLPHNHTPWGGGQFNWTEISFETPGSSIVTPYRRSAISIVLRLCVMRMNCVCFSMARSISTNRPTLASSSGASISSSRQNGLGLYLKSPNI